MPEALPSPNPLLILAAMGILAWIVATYILAALRFVLRLPLLPPSTPRLVPWKGLSVLAAILVWFGTLKYARDAYALIDPAGAARLDKEATATPVDQMIVTGLANVATIVLVPLVLSVTARARRRDFGLADPGPARLAAWGFFAYPVLAPCIFGALLLAIRIWEPTSHPLQKALQGQLTPGLAALVVLSAVVLAPIAEELMFRGVLLGWLTRGGLRSEPVSRPSEEFQPGLHPEGAADPAVAEVFADPITARPEVAIAPVTVVERPSMLLLANVSVSLIFAGLHSAVWPTPIPIFFLSLGLGFLYQRTGSLVPPIALHMTLNGISTLIMFLGVGTNAPGDPRVTAPLPVRVSSAAPSRTAREAVDSRGRLGRRLDRSSTVR